MSLCRAWRHDGCTEPGTCDCWCHGDRAATSGCVSFEGLPTRQQVVAPEFLPTAREYIQLERAMQQAEIAWRHEVGGPQRAAEMRRAFNKLWDVAYAPAECDEQ